jgi:hypothetical protein
MSDATAARAPEVAAKLALRLRRIGWFAWGAACGSSAVPPGAGSGACILTDEAVADRLRDEAVAPGFAFHVTPWEEPEWRDRCVLESAGAAPVLSAPEQQRYRQPGRDAAALSAARRGRRHGRHAKLTRFVSFGPVCALHAGLLAASVQGRLRPLWLEAAC